MDEPVNRQKWFCQNSLCSLTSVSGWVLKSASCVWRLCLLWLNSALKTRRRTLLSLSPPVISSRYDTHFMLSWQQYNKTFIKEERGGVLISKQMHTVLCALSWCLTCWSCKNTTQRWPWRQEKPSTHSCACTRWVTHSECSSVKIFFPSLSCSVQQMKAFKMLKVFLFEGSQALLLFSF